MSTALALQLASPTSALDSFLQQVKAIPVLTAEEEHNLAVRFSENGDVQAARQLVMSQLRFVVHIARGYQGYGLPLGDLIQEGNIGLMKAVKHFDPAIGVRLVSYAVHWIRSEIHEYVLRNWRIVKIATTKAQRKLFFNLRSAKKRLGWLNNDEVKTVADDLGVTPEHVLEMEQRLSAHDMPFDGPDTADDDAAVASPAGFLPDNRFEPAALLEHDQSRDLGLAQLREGLQELDERSRDIVQRRWLNDNKATLQELADQYGVSAERIRQLEKNALKKLRTALAPA